MGLNTKIKDKDLPIVGYMTMSLSRRNLMDVVIDANHQNYPSHLKRMYVTHQRQILPRCPGCNRVIIEKTLGDAKLYKHCPYCGMAAKFTSHRGEFPAHPTFAQNVIPFPVIQINVEGLWPGLWLDKFISTINAMERDGVQVLVVYDEDDRYTLDYTRIAVEQLINEKAKAVWNHRMIFVTFEGMKYETYGSAYGTLVTWVPEIAPILKVFKGLHPDGLMIDKIQTKVPLTKAESRTSAHKRRRRKKYKVVETIRRIGPLDGPFRRFMENKLMKANVKEGTHIRYYYQTLTCATYVSGRHPGRAKVAVNGTGGQ